MKAATKPQDILTLRPLSQRRVGTVGPDACTVATPVEPIAIWGGVECTRNRVGDAYFDQAELSGHLHRTEDFSSIAALGIRTLRVGMLWEHFEREPSWLKTDASIAALRRLKIRPIAGLMHHGSGPAHTSLLDPDFPQQLAAYAGALAERYPDVDAYTPVNEPNTTARFSGQYGLWYPHHRSHRSYLRALLNQAKATVLSMEAIRRVRPDAQLVQTDDCGNITSTAELQSIAELLDTRQWLTFDLLFGRVDRHHSMFDYMQTHGIGEQEILWFQDHPCPPQVLGINYYATSDRYLDHRHWLYPAWLVSSEGPFVDVESIRVEGCGSTDFLRPVMQAWHLYKRPVALTEVHLGGPAAEQIRWLAEAYAAMERAKESGVQCEAVTVWALLGSYFWNELVTSDNGYYEPGAFDVRSGVPVPTAMAEFVRDLATDAACHAACMEPSGWWARRDRTCYPWADEPDTKAA